MYKVTDVTASQGKLFFKIQNLETAEKLTLTVGKEFLPPFANTDSKGREYDEEEYLILHEMSLVTEAAAKALSILSHSNQSKTELKRKLVTKYRIEKDHADAAVAYVSKRGYIDEETQVRRLADKCVNGKNYGKAKTVAYLMQKGYQGTIVKEAVEEIDDEAFETAAYNSLIKKAKTPPETKEEKIKLLSSLLRQGHSKKHVESAFRLFEKESIDYGDD